MKKVNIRRLCSLLMALIMISLLLTTAYATSYATYETYDCKNNYVSSRTWSIPAGNMRIKAVFDLGGISTADTMRTEVTTSAWNSSYMIQAECYLQGMDGFISKTYGQNSRVTSSCSTNGNLWEKTKFAEHTGNVYYNGDYELDRYYKGMYYYQDGVGRSTNGVSDAERTGADTSSFMNNIAILQQ